MHEKKHVEDLNIPTTRYELELEVTAFNAPQVDVHLAVLAERVEAQIAFAGRSNVGKSSLLNALGGRKNLARISSTPGKTRSVNFYHVTPGDYTLADLPGYGYARCSQGERQSWAKLINHYLTTAPGLRGLALLLDCRLDPQQLDRDLANYARDHGITLMPILTKADKCTQTEQATRRKQWAAILDGVAPHVVSAVNRRGIEALRVAINTMMGVGPAQGVEAELTGAEPAEKTPTETETTA